MNKMLVLAVPALVMTLAGTPAVWAADTFCTDTLPPGTYDNVIVPEDVTLCELGADVTVRGTIKVLRNAGLQTIGTRIEGNIEGDGHDIINIIGGTFVGGNVVAKKGTGARFGVQAIFQSTIGGNVLVEENGPGDFSVSGNMIRGDLQVFKNTGSVSIFNNLIGGNLQCKENTTIQGGGNVIGGSKEDQCATF